MSGVPDPPPPAAPVRAAGAVTPPGADNGAVESQAPAAAGRNPAPGPREVVILGSTGSDGTPARHTHKPTPDPLPGVPPAAARTPAPGPREVVFLGSTGSIGTQALDIIRRNPDRFRVVALAAGGGNPELLARQAAEFGVAAVAVANPGAVPAVQAALRALFSRTDSATTLPPPA